MGECQTRNGGFDGFDDSGAIVDGRTQIFRWLSGVAAGNYDIPNTLGPGPHGAYLPLNSLPMGWFRNGYTLASFHWFLGEEMA